MDGSATKFAPPFTKSTALRSSTRGTLPHALFCEDQILNPRTNTLAFLEKDLTTPRLSKIHQHLWLAGFPRPARPLHRQRLLSRTVYLTESPDEHLVWHEGLIYIKPMPEYLLDFEFWDQELCRNEALYRSACGLLMSYSWLIRHRSDMRIAHDTGLLPASITHEEWTDFMIDFASHTNALRLADCRYGYGELRLSRLSSLYRVGVGSRTLRNLVNGFMPGSIRYTAFFGRNFAWILVVLVYIGVILSAMQVALATERFSKSERFQHFSANTALLSLVFVIGVASFIFMVWLTLFWFHLVSTLRYRNRVALRERNKAVSLS